MATKTALTQVETVVRDALDAVAITQIPDICQKTELRFFDVSDALKSLKEKGIAEQITIDRWYYWRLSYDYGKQVRG